MMSAVFVRCAICFGDAMEFATASLIRTVCDRCGDSGWHPKTPE